MRDALKKVLKTIRDNKGEAYLVGGCVRDIILNREPNDYDIATNLMPEEIMKIFPKVIPTGIKHLTVTVMQDGYTFEVTTYRKDVKYSDGRHPDEVIPADSLREDLSRRDFTMNSLASYDIDCYNIIDYFNGVEHIKSKLIKCVGNAHDRFKEDKLRILRAIRFSAQLNFELDINIKTEMYRTSLKQISNERIRDELIKILKSDNPCKGIDIIVSNQILKNEVIPELLPMIFMDGGNHHDEPVYNHSLDALKYSVALTKKWELRLAILLHDIGKPTALTNDENGNHFIKHELYGCDVADKILRRLKFSNETRRYIKTLIKYHMSTYRKIGCVKLSKRQIKKAVRNVGEENLWDMMILNYCDDKANRAHHTTRFEKFLADRTIWYDWQEIKKRDSALKVTDLAVNGHDIMKLGYKGKEVGDILNELLDMVDRDALKNDYESLIGYARGDMNDKLEKSEEDN